MSQQLNQNSKTLRFASLVGQFESDRYKIAYEKYQNALINFDNLHDFAITSSQNLALELKAKYKGETILDFGDEPAINKYHNDIYDLILTDFDSKFPKIIQQATNLIDRLFKTLENIKNKAQPIDQYIEDLEKQSIEIGDLMLFLLMTSEIIESIHRFHYQKFDRPFFKDLWIKSTQKTETYKRFLFHPITLNLHYIVKFLISEITKNEQILQKNNDSSQKVQNEENFALVSTENDLSEIRLKKLQQLLEKIHEEVFFQENLKESYNVFLSHSLDHLPDFQISNKIFLEKFTKIYFQKDLDYQTFQDFVQSYSEDLGTVRENEEPFYSAVDLWLVYFHTFIALTNSYGLSITSYLYVQYFDLNTSISGIIQAAVPLGSFCFGFFWNWTTSFKSYKPSILLSIFLLCLSNVLYYVANMFTNPNIKGIVVLVIARVILGIGGARLMTRKYVALTVKPFAATKYSSILVAVSSFAICAGPGLQAVMLYLPNPPVMIGTSIMDFYNILAFVYIWVWMAMFVLFLFAFTGYDKKRFDEKAMNKHKILHVFHVLHRFEFKSVLNEIMDRNKVKIPQIKKVKNVKIDQKLSENEVKNNEVQELQTIEDLNSPKTEFIEESLQNPFHSKSELENIINFEKEQIVKNININQYSPEVDIIPTINIGDDIIEDHPIDKKQIQPNNFTWRSKIKYLVYHPNAYTFFATFCLFLTKVY